MSGGLTSAKMAWYGLSAAIASPSAAVAAVSTLAPRRVSKRCACRRVWLSGSTTSKEFYDGLTERELEILKLMATGQANKQIARRLAISEKTVRNHVSHMYEKLQIYDRSQAVLYAVRKGLVEL